jgi:glutamate/tyrosine decarboxylase-like PLP-dependent enzyme
MARKVELPDHGIPYANLLKELEEIHQNDVKPERAFGYVYHYTPEYEEFLKKAHNIFFTANALNPLAFPSLRKFEAEVVSMTASMLNGSNRVCGNITSGGSESILMTIKTYRDYYRKKHPEIKRPEIIVPSSAHPAFHKAAHYFGVAAVVAPLDSDFHVDIEAVNAAISPNTILIVGSACDYPRGGMDPIKELATLAQERGIGFHTDSCLGGYMLPFLKKLGYPIPDFDFSVPGVTSISADLHKYGFSAKGASVLLFKDDKLWKNQFHAYTEWPGGIYTSPTMNGTRSGAVIASAWAAMRSFGMDGYMKIAKEAKDATDRLINGIKAIPELKIFGHPVMTTFSFGSGELNIYAVAEAMFKRKYVVDRLQRPSACHLIVNAINASIVDEFLKDLTECVAEVKANPQKANEGEAAMYGLMTTFTDRSKLEEMVLNFLADQYKIR